MSTFLYSLSIAWGLAVTACLIAGIYYLWSGEDGFWFPFGFSLFAIPIGLVVAALPAAAVTDLYSPDLATLKKGEWVCTASHQQTRTQMVLVGKVMIPQVITETICDRYERTTSHD